MAGRPTVYNETIATEICARLAEGESLRSICDSEGMPCRRVVLEWALNPEHPFSNQYEKARQMQADSLADELQDIADDGRNDWMERNVKGKVDIVCDHEHIQRSRLRVDTRKWIASKLKPKRYGDKTQHEHSGSISLESLVSGSQDKPE